MRSGRSPGAVAGHATRQEPEGVAFVGQTSLPPVEASGAVEARRL